MPGFVNLKRLSSAVDMRWVIQTDVSVSLGRLLRLPSAGCSVHPLLEVGRWSGLSSGVILRSGHAGHEVAALSSSSLVIFPR